MPGLSFTDEGRGPVLVFLHGFCESLEIWKDFIQPFTLEFRVITLDLPGFGHSTSQASPFSIDDIGNNLARWLHERELSNCLLIGHSLGGYVALSITALHPDLVKGLVLFHSTARADSDEKKVNRNRIIQFVEKNGVQPYIDTFVPGLFFDHSNPCVPMVHAIASRTKKKPLIDYSNAMRDRPDRSEMMHKIEIPKLLIAGVEDTLIPIEISRETAKMSKNLEFLELATTGHMGIFEAKNECQNAVTQFAYQIFPQ